MNINKFLNLSIYIQCDVSIILFANKSRSLIFFHAQQLSNAHPCVVTLVCGKRMGSLALCLTFTVTYGMSFVIRIGFLFVYMMTAEGKLVNKSIKIHSRNSHVFTSSRLETMLLTRP